MKLAKQSIDIGVFTNRESEMLRFWQDEAGLPFEERLATGGGAMQHRHGLNGSVFKLNASREPIADGGWTGYRELVIAREGVTAPIPLTDPDGSLVTLVPGARGGVEQMLVRIGVREESAHNDFFGRILGCEPAGPNRYRVGRSLIEFAHDPAATYAGPLRATPGYRYLTIQVWDCDAEHAAIIAAGGTEGAPPRTLGTTARFSFIRDPDGNWIEISQRASLTGALPG